MLCDIKDRSVAHIDLKITIFIFTLKFTGL